MRKVKRPSAKEIAKLTAEMAMPRATASVLALMGYECSRCGCRFPESRPRKGRTDAESRLIEEALAAKEFEKHACSERGWPSTKATRELKKH